MSVLSVRCGKSTGDFLRKGPPAELNKATAKHRRVGAVSAMISAGVGIVVPLLLLVFARLL